LIELPRCPRCRERVVQKSLDGKVRIRSNLIAFGAHGAEAICRKCGAAVPVDLEIGGGLKKALQAEGWPRLIVRRKVVDEGKSDT